MAFVTASTVARVAVNAAAALAFVALTILASYVSTVAHNGLSADDFVRIYADAYVPKGAVNTAALRHSPRHVLIPLSVAVLAFVVVATASLGVICVRTRSLRRRVVFQWLMLSGLISLVGTTFHALLADTILSDEFWIAELWKEYAIADSRYLTNDPLVAVLSLFSASIVAPLCITAAILTYFNHRVAPFIAVSAATAQFSITFIYVFQYRAAGFPNMNTSLPLYYRAHFLLPNVTLLVGSIACLATQLLDTIYDLNGVLGLAKDDNTSSNTDAEQSNAVPTPGREKSRSRSPTKRSTTSVPETTIKPATQQSEATNSTTVRRRTKQVDT